MMAKVRLSSLFVSVSLLLPFMMMMIPNTKSAPLLWRSNCLNTTMFANHSEYETNLNNVFRALSSNATNPTGYSQAISRNGSNEAVYAHFLCRGDQSAASCRECVDTATTSGLPRIRCPNRKNAIIWYEECMVRYSNESFFGRFDENPRYPMANIENITGSKTQFMDAVGNMMNDMTVRITNGEPQKKYATSVSRYSNLQTLYGMGQCTPDLSASDCNRCLKLGAGVLPVSIGARIYMPSCNVRYEIYPFFQDASNGKSRPPVVAIVVPIVVLLALLIALGVYYFRRKAKNYLSLDIKKVLEDFTTVESLMFELETLQIATNYFADEQKLGGGGFGNVYKGTLPDGQEIAVKRLSRISDQGMESFKNEAVLIAKLQHKNLVRLLGFCLTGQEKLLVYELVPNKSLNYFLFDPRKQGELDWRTRYNIITGIARGLLYLHEDSRPTIIHRDLKAANILLEADMNPKIADFGLARMFKVEQTEENTTIIAGTYGYMAPEYAMHGQFSIKSDVYSFSVLLLEIVSGKKISNKFHSSKEGDLLTYAWKSWKTSTPSEFIDLTLGHSYSNDEVLKCLHLGLLSVQENAQERPTMSMILFMLNTNSTTSTLPRPRCPRSFYDRSTESFHVITSEKHSTKTTLWLVMGLWVGALCEGSPEDYSSYHNIISYL